MSGSEILGQFLSGISRGMVLFLITSGLTLVFSVMNVLNFAHAALWLLGAYFTYTFWVFFAQPVFGLWISIPLAGFTMAGIGWVIEYLLMRKVYKRDLTDQLLLTYALVLIIGDAIKLTWGVEDLVIKKPVVVSGVLHIFGAPLPAYYALVIFVAALIAVTLWWFLQKNRFGSEDTGLRVQPGNGKRTGYPYLQTLHLGFLLKSLYRGRCRGYPGACFRYCPWNGHGSYH